MSKKDIIEWFLASLHAIWKRRSKRKKPPDLAEGMYIGQREADSLLQIALSPTAKSIAKCRNKTAAHATAVGVASLVAYSVLGEVNHLRNQFDACCGEIYIERDYDKKKLEELVGILLSLNSQLKNLTDDRSSGSEPRDSRNIMIMAFNQLPQRQQLLNYHTEIGELRKKLETEIIAGIKGLLWKMHEHQGADLESEARHLVRLKLGELRALYKRLEKLSEELKDLAAAIGTDWNHHVNEIWK